MTTLGLKNINMLSKEQYATVDEPATDELYAISGSGFGFPSSNYEDLELGASGSTYTAPANGWFAIGKTPTATNQRLAMFSRCTNNSVRMATGVFSSASQANLFVYLPVMKNEIVTVMYTVAGGTDHFRFIYAEGE